MVPRHDLVILLGRGNAIDAVPAHIVPHMHRNTCLLEWIRHIVKLVSVSSYLRKMLDTVRNNYTTMTYRNLDFYLFLYLMKVR